MKRIKEFVAANKYYVIAGVAVLIGLMYLANRFGTG